MLPRALTSITLLIDCDTLTLVALPALPRTVTDVPSLCAASVVPSIPLVEKPTKPVALTIVLPTPISSEPIRRMLPELTPEVVIPVVLERLTPVAPIASDCPPAWSMVIEELTALNRKIVVPAPRVPAFVPATVLVTVIDVVAEPVAPTIFRTLDVLNSKAPPFRILRL